MHKYKKKTDKEKQLDLQAKELRSKQKNMSPKDILEEKKLKTQRVIFDGAVLVTSTYGLSGVYYLFNDETLVYIGESECMITRISQHIKDGVKTFTHYKLHACKNRKKREKKDIIRHRPVYNATHNPNIRLTKR